ncbi:hypothetical protein ACFORJ_09840 [Corynebacterium hansenii]|uniref:Secreted protein n=1 Tax=Corynebacterium hansenii TaxID=394964 RepID=A0ABV7ZQP9_9CORY|nr:hypothetical protein [Corynebacterium hansenii]
MKKKKMATMFAAIASCIVLVGCGGDVAPDAAGAESSADQASPPSAASGVDPGSFDSGPFFDKYRIPLKKIDNAEVGRVVESTAIGNSMPLASEIDPDFTVGRGGREVIGSASTSFFFGKENIESLKPFDPSYRGGYFRLANDVGRNKTVTVAALRYETPEIAARASAALYESYTNSAPTESESMKGEGWVNGLPTTRAIVWATEHKDDKNEAMFTFSTEGEFIFYIYYEGGEGSIKDIREFHSEYLSRVPDMVAELADIAKTDESGKVVEWPEVDPDGLLRYAVSPLGDEKPALFPATNNPRGYAGTQSFVTETKQAVELSGIESLGVYNTAVARARSNTGAQAMQSAVITVYESKDYEIYEDPQGLPDVTCAEGAPTPGGMHLTCVMVYGDKVAIGEEVYFERSSGKSRDVRESESEKNKPKTLEEARKRLSQKMAAQYKIFRDAEVNPEGSKLPGAEVRDEPSSEAPTVSGTMSTEKPAGSAEPTPEK